jgi:hypothetical protein
MRSLALLGAPDASVRILFLLCFPISGTGRIRIRVRSLLQIVTSICGFHVGVNATQAREFRGFHVRPFMRVCAIAGFCILTSSARCNTIALEAAPWRDLSPHRITFVTVDHGVKLEVLDWGGNGVRLCCWLDTKRRTNTMNSLRNSRPSVTFMESPDGDSALPLDQIQATPRSGQQKTL